MAIDLNASPNHLPVQQVRSKSPEIAKIRLSVLRLDTVHPLISGNKWFKLKENLTLAKKHGKSTLITFGGVWSNHLMATAVAAKQNHFQSIGLVRRPFETSEETATLKICRKFGMTIQYLNRQDYHQKYAVDFLKTLQYNHPEGYIIPEGGNNDAGRKGAGEIVRFILPETSHLALPVGTGSTFQGIRQNLPDRIKMLGFVPFKKAKEQEKAITTLCGHQKEQNWSLYTDTKWKGFGQFDESLLRFMNDFYTKNKIPLDLVYTGKMMFYLSQMISNGVFPDNSHILALHTGGLQGNASVTNRLVYAS